MKGEDEGTGAVRDNSNYEDVIGSEKIQEKRTLEVGKKIHLIHLTKEP